MPAPEFTPPTVTLTVWTDQDAYVAAEARAKASNQRMSDIARKFTEAIAAGAVKVPTQLSGLTGRAAGRTSRSVRLRTTLLNGANGWLRATEPTMSLSRLLSELIVAYGEHRVDEPTVAYRKVVITPRAKS